MLDKPKYGWSRISIGEWSDRCSYLDDIAIDLLEGMERSCRTNAPVAMRFDAEGYEYIIVVDIFETHIITEIDTGFSLQSVSINRCFLASELVCDIRDNISAWSAWFGEEMTDSEICERSKNLLALCDIVEKYNSHAT